MSKARKLYLACGFVAVVGLLGVGTVLLVRSTQGQTPAGVRSDGSIAVPEDLQDQLSKAITQLEQAEALARVAQPTLEQIARVSLWRAGVPASEIGKWQFDRKSRLLTKIPEAK